MAKAKKKKFAIRKKIIAKKKKPAAKKKISRKSRRQSRRGSSIKSGPKSIIEISKEKFDYFMAKIAAI